jgi:hypothetical protein
MVLIYWVKIYDKNTDVLLVTCKEIGLEVNVDKKKFMFMAVNIMQNKVTIQRKLIL